MWVRTKKRWVESLFTSVHPFIGLCPFLRFPFFGFCPRLESLFQIVSVTKIPLIGIVPAPKTPFLCDRAHPPVYFQSAPPPPTDMPFYGPSASPAYDAFSHANNKLCLFRQVAFLKGHSFNNDTVVEWYKYDLVKKRPFFSEFITFG